MQVRDELIHLDYSHIDRMDPCLVNAIIYDQEMPFLVRFFNSDSNHDDKHTIEMIRVRIMILGKPKDFTQLTIELTSENDLFFYYFHTVDHQNYNHIKAVQKLSVEFRDYPEVCIKSFNKCQNEQQQYAPILNLMPQQRASLTIIQTSEYKELEIISFDMIAGDEDIIRQHATYKFGCVKAKFQMIEGKLREVCEIVRMRNPQLLLHIHKYMNQNRP